MSVLKNEARYIQKGKYISNKENR